jgi:hypothetical protein
MRAVLAALVVLVPAVAHADPIGPAFGMSLAFSDSDHDVGHGGGNARFEAGAQRGRVAVLGNLELVTFHPANEVLDSSTMVSWGAGLSLRVDVLRPSNKYLQAEIGLDWRAYDGNGEVRRGCMVFGGCDAGFYMETPRYKDVAPYIAIDLGARTRKLRWWGGGVQIGATLVTLDRAGTAPDSHGAMVWLGLQGATGTY